MTLFAAQRINCDVIIDEGELTARIFNIQRYSLNDGHGIRTVVFFKGCPHHCPWCANPESISGKIQTVRRVAKCIHCATCLNDADECPTGATERIGRDISFAALEKEVLKDEIFFRASGGGVTLSGGEVLMQAAFVTRFLKRLKSLGIRTAIETAGDAAPEKVLALAQQCDEVLFDLKIMDVAQAKNVLNMHQSRVLENFRLLVEADVCVIPRVPLIPGYTLDLDNMQAIINFLAPMKLTELHLLPFHQYGEPKYQLLGKPWQMAGIAPPDEREIAQMRRMAEDAGYRVIIGG
ncbi:[formate-C-acetyltransferase]-activating enzyme [Buttiauxella selenatireducens]|uniref:[formate-C-acetyltransferase]-activating enzyme n=1 Tax=Buttiauxella selenatireducens TaxID=3073902 RepID=A0ABY9SAY4_9ENTR|nr:[formate-C-acetyltransferase]-activating enzyme [Buttiauxella sp. R73]WMY74270.1 [formate-C-acetyltransferase]-activating enzyme [Buttiauxella sp. R73]